MGVSHIFHQFETGCASDRSEDTCCNPRMTLFGKKKKPVKVVRLKRAVHLNRSIITTMVAIILENKKFI